MSKINATITAVGGYVFSLENLAQANRILFRVTL